MNRSDISLKKRKPNDIGKISSSNIQLLSFNPFDFKNDSNLFYPYVKIRSSQKIIKHILFWTISSITLFYFISLVKPLDEALERTTINIVGFMALFYVSRFLVLTYYEEKQYKKWISFSLAIVTFTAIARTIIEVDIIGTTLFSEKTFSQLSFKLKFSLFGFYFVIGHIFFLFFTVYNISKIKSTLEFRLAKYKFQHAELKLRLLNTQLDPHFLFNTLNGIYAISILDNTKTPDLILKLSDILRFITQNSQLKRIPFATEVEQTKNFIELFHIRNDKPINIIFEVPDQLDNIYLIPMTLLTLVENAVKYGNLTNDSHENYIKIKITTNRSSIDISVTNSFNRNTVNEKGTGLGNKTLRERLELEYPGKYQFSVTETKKHFTADLKILFNE